MYLKYYIIIYIKCTLSRRYLVTFLFGYIQGPLLTMLSKSNFFSLVDRKDGGGEGPVDCPVSGAECKAKRTKNQRSLI